MTTLWTVIVAAGGIVMLFWVKDQPWASESTIIGFAIITVLGTVVGNRITIALSKLPKPSQRTAIPSVPASFTRSTTKQHFAPPPPEAAPRSFLVKAGAVLAILGTYILLAAVFGALATGSTLFNGVYWDADLRPGMSSPLLPVFGIALVLLWCLGSFGAGALIGRVTEADDGLPGTVICAIAFWPAMFLSAYT
ncbi:hypothetical protein VD659_03810 [Herbiconiux sp. 11R-BC]|uniref:hypothetical protein n=1 Tax=Herbiconiux sp. 11R-BC TaxID=3111637 RepID=UPI003BFC926E